MPKKLERKLKKEAAKRDLREKKRIVTSMAL